MLSIILSRSVSFIAKIGGSLAAQSGSPRFKMADAAGLSIPSFVPTRHRLIHVACPLPRFAEPFILLGSPHPITALRRSRKSALTTSCQRDRFLFSHLCRWADCETSPPGRTLGRLRPGHAP